MIDFNFRTMNIESLAQKNKEDALKLIKEIATPKLKPKRSIDSD